VGEGKDLRRDMTNDKPVKNRAETGRTTRGETATVGAKANGNRAGSRRMRRTHPMLFKLCGLPAR